MCGIKHHGHEHQDHATRPASGGHDLAMMGVLLHVIGDAANNLGVIIAALVIWLARYEGRYYADPGTSMGIAIMIILSSFPLGKFVCQSAVTVTNSVVKVRRSGLILLESSPDEVDPREVKGALEKVRDLIPTVHVFWWFEWLIHYILDIWRSLDTRPSHLAVEPAENASICTYCCLRVLDGSIPGDDQGYQKMFPRIWNSFGNSPAGTRSGDRL